MSKLAQKLAEAKAQKAQEQATQLNPEPAPSPALEKYAHLAPEPDFEPDPFASLLDDMSIIDAYNKWCGKSKPNPRPGQTESIMVSCPKPNHPDKNPSAWLNTISNTWFCAGCQEGGDVYDIAAMHFDIRDYKGKGPNFGNLRKAMAESLGYGVAKIGKKDIPYKKDDTPSPEPETSNVVDLAARRLSVDPTLIKPPGTPELPISVGGSGNTKTNEDLDRELAEVIELGVEDQIIFPTLDWKKIVTPGTFLDEYMAACTVDDIAEEYHFWNALVALGLACGRDAFLRDSPPVYGNLFVCLLGLTGDGKSRSVRHLRKVLAEALPFDPGDDYPKGVNLAPTPSSAEALITSFTHAVLDPNNTRVTVGYAPIRGLVDFGEMAELTGKANRLGNVLKPALIDFYDMKDQVSTMSIQHGVKRAMQPFCSLTTSTQPESLKTILGAGDKASGFLNRWVFASGKPKVRSFFQEDIVEYDKAIETLKRVVGWVGFGKEIVCDSDAVSLMEDFYHSELARLVQTEGSGMLSRLPLLYKKLLLLLAANDHSPIVTAEHADKVISMHQYSVEAYGIPSKNIGSDDLTAIYEEIARQLKRLTKDGDGPTYGHLKKVLAPRNFPIALVDRALKILENMHEIEIYAKESGRGRPTQRYRWIAS